MVPSPLGIPAWREGEPLPDRGLRDGRRMVRRRSRQPGTGGPKAPPAEPKENLTYCSKLVGSSPATHPEASYGERLAASSTSIQKSSSPPERDHARLQSVLVGHRYKLGRNSAVTRSMGPVHLRPTTRLPQLAGRFLAAWTIPRTPGASIPLARRDLVITLTRAGGLTESTPRRRLGPRPWPGRPRATTSGRRARWESLSDQSDLRRRDEYTDHMVAKGAARR
jgi:hypothetical protein